MRTILSILLFLVISTVAQAQHEACQIKYYLFTNGTPALSAWYAGDETFDLQDDGNGVYLTYWTPTNIPAPVMTNLPDSSESARWLAANRPSLPMERQFTNLLYSVGVTNVMADPLYPGRFTGIYDGLLTSVQAETNLATKVSLHTLSISLDALYQELREHLDTAIYSPYLGTTNDLATGPIP